MAYHVSIRIGSVHRDMEGAKRQDSNGRDQALEGQGMAIHVFQFNGPL